MDDKQNAFQPSACNKIFNICFIMFFLVYFGYLFFLGSHKINFHIDEYFTYALANKQEAQMPVWPVWQEGEIYEGTTYFEESLMPAMTERFNYNTVYENQANDVHPPLYYMLVHTLCSIFPEHFSKWHGLVINYIFMFIINLLVFFIAKSILHNRWTALITMIINAMSVLSLNMVLFLRMYGLMTVFGLGITAVFLAYFGRDKDRKFYLGICILAVGGALTQYYFLIFLFFLCLVYASFMLINKKWKEIVFFVGTMTAAGISSICLFPPMIVQIFGGSDRGKEAFQNIRTLPNMAERLKQYFEIINNEVFGGWIVLFIILSLVLVALIVSKQWVPKENIYDFIILFFPMLGYCVLVALIAPYIQNRYIMCSGSFWNLTGVWIVYYLFLPLWKNQKQLKTNILITSIFVVIVVLGLQRVNWWPTYTYQYMKEKYNQLEDYHDCRVICIYDNSWTINDNFVEIKEYKNYMFVTPKKFSIYIQMIEEEEELVIYNESNLSDDEIIDIIMESNNKLIDSQRLFKNSSESILYFKFQTE